MDKHTPGPWSLSDYGWSRRSDGGHPVFMGRISGNGGQLVHSGSAFGIFGKTEGEAEGNARLISAAPEMLEALKALVDDLGHFPGVSERIFHSLNLADAAIAKGEGR